MVVDTDSPPIIEGLHANFPQVLVLERPEHLRADQISMNEILAYDTSQVEADLYLQTHSTNPLLRSATVSRAIQALLADYPAYDSLFSVTRMQVRLWDQLGRAINHNPAILIQTQDLPPVYEENSCIYIFNRQNLLQTPQPPGRASDDVPDRGGRSLGYRRRAGFCHHRFLDELFRNDSDQEFSDQAASMSD